MLYRRMSMMDDRAVSIIPVTMETIGSRLRAVRLAQNLTQEDLGKIAGVTKQAISAIERDATKNAEGGTLEPICRRLGINMRWMLKGKGPQYDPGQEGESAGWADVMGYAQAAGLGDGEEADEYAETHRLKFRSDSLRRKSLNARHLGVVYGKGDSMLPRIRSGDAILFDTSDIRPADEALFLILCYGIAGDGYSVKRCRLFGNHLFFDSLNPEGDHNWRKPRAADDPKHPITIIGRVRWIGSWED